MNLKKNAADEHLIRRSRLHEILIALIKQQKDLELMDDGVQTFENHINHSDKYDPSKIIEHNQRIICLLYTSPSPRDGLLSRMPSSA